MSIKSQTVEQIEQVLSQNKKYYRIYDFPFPTNKNGYSTHQGAVLRYYLREKGYTNVRVSEIHPSFFGDNQNAINSFLKGKTINVVMLKPSNSIIIRVEDFEKYKMNKPMKFKPNFHVDNISEDNKPKVAVIGVGDYPNFRKELSKVSTTRQLIIDRLEEFREKERGFSKSTMRWQNITIDFKGSTTHISDVNWNELSDQELLLVFERIIRRYYTQM